jgi:hypothetical protein
MALRDNYNVIGVIDEDVDIGLFCYENNLHSTARQKDQPAGKPVWRY